MSPYPPSLHVRPWVCLHLLGVLLLLLSVSSAVDPAPAEPPTLVNATRANCSSGCGDVQPNTTHLQDSSSSLNLQSNDSVATTASNQQPVSPPETAPLPAPTPAAHPEPTSTSTSTTTAAPTTAGSVTTASLVTPATTTTASTTTTTTPAPNTTTTTTASTTTTTTPAPNTTTTTTTTTASTTTTTTTPAPNTTTTTTTTTTPTAAPHPVTTAGTTVSPPPPPAATAKPPVHTSAPTQPTTTTSITTTSTSTSTVAPGTRGGVVDGAGGALTRQLADTASLLAVLLFGLLFFLVTVAVFVTQAYESYRRKDYTQVDYLINGMYTDSGV